MARVTVSGAQTYRVTLTPEEDAVLQIFTAEHQTTVTAMLEAMVAHWAAQNHECALRRLREQIAEQVTEGAPTSASVESLRRLQLVRVSPDRGRLEPVS